MKLQEVKIEEDEQEEERKEGGGWFLYKYFIRLMM